MGILDHSYSHPPTMTNTYNKSMAIICLLVLANVTAAPSLSLGRRQPLQTEQDSVNKNMHSLDMLLADQREKRKRGTHDEAVEAARDEGHIAAVEDAAVAFVEKHKGKNVPLSVMLDANQETAEEEAQNQYFRNEYQKIKAQLADTASEIKNSRLTKQRRQRQNHHETHPPGEEYSWSQAFDWLDLLCLSLVCLAMACAYRSYRKNVMNIRHRALKNVYQEIRCSPLPFSSSSDEKSSTGLPYRSPLVISASEAIFGHRGKDPPKDPPKEPGSNGYTKEPFEDPPTSKDPGKWIQAKLDQAKRVATPRDHRKLDQAAHPASYNQV